jgi:predicted metal-dependent hydrolase
MAGKTRKILAWIEPFQGRELDARYLGYFDCFRRGLFFEAHEVLEDLWLADRAGPEAAFYKGLIQLAGAFVHLQKGRLRPAAALFRLAEANLKQYQPVHEQLDVDGALAMIRQWLGRLEAGRYEVNPLALDAPSGLELKGGG